MNNKTIKKELQTSLFVMVEVEKMSSSESLNKYFFAIELGVDQRDLPKNFFKRSKRGCESDYVDY